MNEQLQDTVNEILKKAVDVASATGDFLKDQIPDVVRQLVLWKTWQYGIFFLLCTAFLVTYFGNFRRLFRLMDSNDDAASNMSLLCLMFGGVLAIPAVIEFFDNGSNLLELLCAPKVWLLEYAAHLVHH